MNGMDHHRLRLVPFGASRQDKRVSPRWAVRVPGQLVWKDARGSTRLARIMTRNVSELGVAVDCLDGTPIPLYRLVYVQIDRTARESSGELPAPLRRPAVLSAVYRVGPSRQTTGTPDTYALRLLVEPERSSRARAAADGAAAPVRRFSRSA
jgi:hypothetical protein